MSSLYALEPQPTAKVLLQTTSGDILLELFAKQTPLTSRNFLQLCLDGYYDGTIFHRLVPDFVIQGGDPTGTGEGGEAIYDGGLFADEFHSRLKFNRRGLLGMANSGRKNDNGSQFFLTLAKTEELQGHNTMFGRVVGDTIYNLMKMSEAELVAEGSERPMYPTKITGTEVLVNPFEDLVRRERKVETVVREVATKTKPKKKKGGKVLLSFGGDDGDEPDVVPAVKKAKFNTKLIGGEAATDAIDTVTIDSVPMPVEKTEKKIKKRPSPSREASTPQRPPPPAQPVPKTITRSPSSSPEPAPMEKVTSLLERTNNQIAELKASMKRDVTRAPAETQKKKSALEQMIPESSVRGRKRKHGAGAQSSNDTEALAILNAFRAKLEQAPAEIPKSPSPPPFEVKATADQMHTNGGPPSRTDTIQPTPKKKKADNDDAEKSENDEEKEEQVCDLHFISNCQSCLAWDVVPRTKQSSNNDGPQADTDPKHEYKNGDDSADNDKSYLYHKLSFAKDRLGKDLTWRKKTEEELVVIDPREQEKEIRDAKAKKKKKKMEVGMDRDKAGNKSAIHAPSVGGGKAAKAWDVDRDRDGGGDHLRRAL